MTKLVQLIKHGAASLAGFTALAGRITDFLRRKNRVNRTDRRGATDRGGGGGLTQFSDNFSTIFIQQDGVPTGVLSGLTISDVGQVVALFDNGLTRPIFKVPLATFSNPNGLGQNTGNIFSPTDKSGDPLLNTAGDGPAGKIAQSALEASTVDIAEEFTKMIITQRAFSANSKVITTADEMLDELVRIKR